MNRQAIKRVLPVLLLLCLSGCTAAGPKGPSLISFSDRQRATIEPAVQTGAYGSIADRLGALPVEAYAGTLVQISETIINDGAPSKGIRLIIKGSAITQGLFDMPKDAGLVGRFEDKKTPDDKAAVLLVADNTGGWHASVPDIKYGSKLDLNIMAPAIRGGEGDIQIYVYPLDRNGKSSAVITHNYKVLSEVAEPQEIAVPTDN